MEAVTASGLLPDIDHPALDHPVTQDADPLVIERIPFPKAVCFPKGDQFFRQRDALIHFDRLKGGNQFDGKTAIRTAPQAGVSKKPSNFADWNRLGKVRIRDDAIVLNLYRIAQEAVNNAVKHARPTHITISLRRTRSALVLEMRDDGAGVSEKSAGKGMVLQSCNTGQT